MIMSMELGLAYDTALTKVKKIVERTGEELAADPELGPELLQPLKSQGVTAPGDSEVVVRDKAVAAEGIRFSSRPVIVQAPPGVPPAAVAGGAALGADAGRDPGPRG